jgi:hypothetical protein
MGTPSLMGRGLGVLVLLLSVGGLEPEESLSMLRILHQGNEGAACEIRSRASVRRSFCTHGRP